MIKTFISYSHREHKALKEEIARYINSISDMSDESVEMGDISNDLPTESVRRKIRDEFLRNTSVTIVLCGNNAPHRKHIDWEIHSSMYDGSVNTKSGIVVIDTIGNYARTSSDDVKGTYNTNWISISDSDIRNRYSHLPEKIIDNLVKDGVSITVLPLNDIMQNSARLAKAIRHAHHTRSSQDYDLSRPMREKNNDAKTI